LSRFHEIFPGRKIIIGLSHLPPLPDYPDSPGIDSLRAHARNDLQLLESGGFDGILIENEYDRPHRMLAEPATIDSMMEITSGIARKAEEIVVGCEILLNDPKASLDVAGASGARFIRTDYFVDRMSRPQYGEFEIDPEGLISYREKTGASDVLIMADIQVKYATMLEDRSLQESARLACLKGADAVVVTGDETGDAPTVRQLRQARSGVVASGFDIPVLIGSGLDTDNTMELLAECEGAIVGTALMRDRKVDAAALQALMIEVEKARA
jgi:membrane complex biogenesis BtpA family protein